MSKKLFIGGLDWGVTSEELREIFSAYGEVEDAVVVTDKFSGRSKGFGFVTFVNGEDADKAIEALDGKELKGRKVAVNEARPPEPRRSNY